VRNNYNGYACCNYCRCRIIGLYLSLVLVIAKLLRMFSEDRTFRIMFEELPNPDYIINLCKDVYLCRERQEWCLEEELFSKLLFLFRSPEILIRVSQLRPRKRKTL